MTPLPPLLTLRRQADAHAKHARGCKKAIDGCPTCIASIAWFHSLPPDVLSRVLVDYGKQMKG